VSGTSVLMLSLDVPTTSYTLLVITKNPARDSANRQISRPDFYFPDSEIYVEYWGMVNTKKRDKRQEYKKRMEWKMARYHENGLKFISVYPQDLHRLDSIFPAHLKR
jgi:hypothetical protein